MTSEFILAFLFLALLVFVYITIRLYSGIIQHLTSVISNLKAFSMGVPQETNASPRYIVPPEIDEDFGVLRKSAVPPESSGTEEAEEDF